MILRKLPPSILENVKNELAERGSPPPGPHPSKLIDELVKDYLASIMKAEKFRKSGANFWRDSRKIIDVLNIQKSQWNDAWDACFYVNIGVYWKEYHAYLGTGYRSKFPHEYDCTAFSRVQEPYQNAWTLRPNSDLSKVGTDLVRAVQEIAFPWFEQMRSELIMLSHLRTQGIADNFEKWLNSHKATLSNRLTK